MSKEHTRAKKSGKAVAFHSDEPSATSERLGQVSLPNNRNCILILGMHRSGTSALTRLISLFGAKLPLRLLGTRVGNETGHWESESLISYHDRMLEGVGSAWHDWGSLKLSSIGPNGSHAVKNEIRNIIAEEFGDAKLFVLKEPRICRFSQLYFDIFEEDSIDVLPIISLRNPLEVIASLARRSKINKSNAALLWLRHVLDAEYTTRRYPRIIINYEQLLSDWRSELQKVFDASKFSFPYTFDEVAPEITQFLAEKYRHHYATPEDVALDPVTQGWVSNAYFALRVLSRSPDSIAAFAELDEIRRAFNDAEGTLRSLIAEAQKAATFPFEQQLKTVEHELDSAQRLVRSHASDVEAKDAKISAISLQLAELSDKLEVATVLNQQLRTVECERADAQQQIHSLVTDADEKAAKILALNLQLEKLNAKFEASTAEQCRLSSEHAIAIRNENDRVRAAKNRAEQVEVALQNIHQSQLSTSAKLEAKARENNELEKKLSTFQRELHKARADLKNASASIEQLHELYRKSTSWRITAPVRMIKTAPKQLKARIDLFRTAIKVSGGPLHSSRKGLKILSEEGFAGVQQRLRFIEQDNKYSAPLESITTVETKAVVPIPLSQDQCKTKKQYQVFAQPPLSSLAHNKRQKILLVAHNSGGHLFGAELSLIDIAAGIDRRRYHVIVTLPREDPAYRNRLAPHADQIIVAHYRWRKGALPQSEEVALFEKIIEDFQVDIVHVNTTALQSPLTAARNKKVKCIVHVREVLPLDPDLALVFGANPSATLSAIEDCSDIVVCNSLATAKFNGFKNSPKIIYNQIADEIFKIENNVDPNNVKVGIISSNISKKGIEEFAHIAERMHETAPNLTFLIIGPENDLVRMLKKKYAGQKNLIFTGYMSSAAEAIRQCNVVLSLSRFMETFGRTAAEAMAAGRIIIAYNWGALPELISHGETGYLLPYREHLAAMPILESIAKNPKKIIEVGARARIAAKESFSSDVLKKSLAELYKNAIPDTHDVQKVKKKFETPISSKCQIKIAYFLWHFPVPSETFVLNELRQLVEAGYHVEVFCRQSPHRDFEPDFSIDHHRVSTPEDLAKKLRQGNFSVAHSHFTYPTVTDFLWPACELAEIPFTFIAHSQDIFRYENDKRNRISEIAQSRYCKRVFVPGSYHHGYLMERGVPENKIMINPQGIHVPLYNTGRRKKRQASERLKVCTVQRFVEKKGIEYLIRAAKLLERDDVDVNIFGYGPLEGSFRSLVAELNIRNVAIHGPINGREALLQVFSEHDLFASPSIRAGDGDMDGIPTVLFEAIAAGLPVLSTTVSSIGDLIREGVTGFVCLPQDPSSIASSIRNFSKMPDARVAAVVDLARRRVVSEYATDKLLRNLLRVWADDHVDVIIVSWNNLAELQETCRRILRFTTAPYRLTIVDNASSDPGIREFLLDLSAKHQHVRILFQDNNKYVGPGTNTALESTTGRFAIYVCGKEGFPLQYGWELSMLSYMEENPRVGIAGTLTYSPSYLRGEDYSGKLECFNKFRNKSFALKNAKRCFQHV